MFKKIIVPLDGSALAEHALGPAAAIARASQAALDLTLVHTPIVFGGFEDAPWHANTRKLQETYLDDVAAELRTGASVSASTAVLGGDPAEKICERAHDVSADLVVMTSHGRTGFNRAWLGSVAHDVVRRSATPVLLVRPSVDDEAARTAPHRLFKRIVVTLDGSEFSHEILSAAADLARCGHGQLVLVRVVEPVPLVVVDVGLPIETPPLATDTEATSVVVEGAKRQLESAKADLAAAGLADVSADVVVAAHVAQAIIDYARDRGADAIAMSTHGRGASRLFLGSVADKVLRASELPMLLRRPSTIRAEPPLLDADSVAEQLPALSGR